MLEHSLAISPAGREALHLLLLPPKDQSMYKHVGPSIPWKRQMLENDVSDAQAKKFKTAQKISALNVACISALLKKGAVSKHSMMSSQACEV